MAYDPGALLIQQEADLTAQNTWAESGFDERKANLEAGNIAANKGLEAQSAAAFKSESNAANRGGLLTSGINGARKGTLVSNFAERREANKRALDEGNANITHEREGGQKQREGLLHGYRDTNTKEKDRIAKEGAATAAEAERRKAEMDSAYAASKPAYTPPAAAVKPQTYTSPGVYSGPVEQKYPGATVAVHTAFPGGINEQRAWIRKNVNVGRK